MNQSDGTDGAPISAADDADSGLPPIRRPVLFYATVTVAFGLLGGAVMALLL